MIIKEKTVFVYDIEVFPNLFTCTLKNTESKQIRTLEISDRQNDLNLIPQIFLNKNIIFCGFNNIHYDNPVINYCLMHYKELIPKPNWEINEAIKKISDTIIGNQENTAVWRKYKYANIFDSLDLLTMMFSSKLRVGLKELQVTMEYHNVQEYEGDFNSYCPNSDIDKVIAYNINDVDSTEELLYRLEEQIKLRLAIEQEYGVDVLSMDGVSIGKEILKNKYLQDTGKTWAEIRDLRSPCDRVSLKEVIIPTICYKDPLLQSVLEEMKTLTVDPSNKGWNKIFNYKGTRISMGVGGIHSVNQPEIIVPKDDTLLLDWDAASLYPSLLIEWGFYPQHLGKEFLDTYANIKKERIEAKRTGNKVKNETLKLTLNSVTGLMQSEYSWLYSPKDVMRIRMNGQLLLLKLAEMLISAANVRVVQYNTDGIVVLLKKDMYKKAQAAVKEFEKFSKLSMEAEEFEAFYQYAINDYIAVYKGYSETKNEKLIKTKGLFIDKVSLGKGMAPQIIAECLKRYFVDKIPVKETLYSCTDIRKFLTYQKVSKEFKIEYNGQLITHINRYYMSTNGYYLLKCKIDPETQKRTDYTSICANSGVTILNELKNVDVKSARINYYWYMSEIYKIIYALEESLNPTLF